MPTNRRRQRGVALLTALLVVALSTLLAAAMAHRQQVMSKRAQNLIAREQALQVARGLEDWAIVALRRDATETGAVDSRQELWAQGLPLLPTDRGNVTGRLEDLDGRFNVNNLVVDGVRNSASLARMRRLLLALGLDPLLAEALADWQDADTIAATDGAEDNDYSRREPPYRAGNRPFAHPSELRLVAGIDAAVYQQLDPHVATLPVRGAPSPLNVNTATVPVLMALDDSVSEEQARRWWANGQAHHESVRAFLEQSRLPPTVQQSLRDALTVDSRYFLARGQVVIDERPQQFFSLIEQGRYGFRVIQRSRGVW